MGALISAFSVQGEVVTAVVSVLFSSLFVNGVSELQKENVGCD